MTTLATSLREAMDPAAFAAARGFTPEPWQSALMRSEGKRSLLACARQTGKSSTLAWLAVWGACHHPARDTLVISPSQRQSDELLNKCSGIVRGLNIQLARQNSSELVWPSGSRIVSLPGSEGTIRGFSAIKLLLLDEAARLADATYQAAVPMVASDGRTIAASTPWGQQGWFYDAWADQAADWERVKVTCYESAQYSEARIAQVRASVGRFVFASDYECSFSDTDAQVFRTEDIRAAFSGGVEPL